MPETPAPDGPVETIIPEIEGVPVPSQTEIDPVWSVDESDDDEHRD